MMGSVKYEFTDWLNIQGCIRYDRYDGLFSRSWANRTLLFAGPGGSYHNFTNDILERNMDVILSGNNAIEEDIAVTYNFGGGSTYKRFSQVGANANSLLVPSKFDLSFA
jgi:hypothetical protein